MPKYRLIFHRKVEKALEDLDAKTKRNLLEDIQCLAEFTGLRSHLDIVKLKGQKDFYRLRSGKLRIPFTLDKPAKTIIIIEIEHRENAYE